MTVRIHSSPPPTPPWSTHSLMAAHTPAHARAPKFICVQEAHASAHRPDIEHKNRRVRVPGYTCMFSDGCTGVGHAHSCTHSAQTHTHTLNIRQCRVEYRFSTSENGSFFCRAVFLGRRICMCVMCAGACNMSQMEYVHALQNDTMHATHHAGMCTNTRQQILCV